MAAFRDPSGAIQQLPMDVSMYALAGRAGMSLPNYLNREYRTDANKFGSSFEQLCQSESIFLRSNAQLGIRASTLDSILNPKIEAGITTTDSAPASRILYPAVFLQAIEDRRAADQTNALLGLNQMIAVDEAISGDRFEQPQINFDRPTAARSMATAQLANPASMMTITVSDKPGTIPSWALGLEISDKAAQSQSLDLVTLSVARQLEVESNERAYAHLLALANGDPDKGDISLSAAGRVRTTTSFDSAATGGVVTQKAWVRYLANRSVFRTIDYVVGDIDAALAIENRTGKPIITTDNATSKRINSELSVVNPQWPNGVKFFLTLDPAWTPGMVMGLDSRYAIRRIRNLQADYTAIENFVLRRSKAMRFDAGETVHRLFSDAFDVLTIA